MPIPQQPAQATPGMSWSGAQFTASCLRMLNIIAEDQQPSGAQIQLGLECANQMLDSWNADRLTIFTIAITDFPFQSSKQTYTLGSGGDFDLPRPPEIERCSVMLLTNPQQPLEKPLHIYLNEAEWQGVALKGITSTFPLAVYDDGGMPYRRLSFWPVPQESDNFRLYSWSPLAQFPDAKTVLTFPPGYQETVRYNLAIRLAAEFAGANLPAAVPALAQASLARIRSRNSPLVKLECETAQMSGKSDDSRGNYYRFLSGG